MIILLSNNSTSIKIITDKYKGIEMSMNRKRISIMDTRFPLPLEEGGIGLYIGGFAKDGHCYLRQDNTIYKLKGNHYQFSDGIQLVDGKEVIANDPRIVKTWSLNNNTLDLKHTSTPNPETVQLAKVESSPSKKHEEAKAKHPVVGLTATVNTEFVNGLNVHAISEDKAAVGVIVDEGASLSATGANITASSVNGSATGLVISRGATVNLSGASISACAGSSSTARIFSRATRENRAATANANHESHTTDSKQTPNQKPAAAQQTTETHTLPSKQEKDTGRFPSVTTVARTDPALVVLRSQALLARQAIQRLKAQLRANAQPTQTECVPPPPSLSR